MTYRVEINQCLDQFHRAHDALIESLGGIEHIARITPSGRGDSHRKVMEHIWKLKYGITPQNDSGSTGWKYLDFASEKHYTTFVLRWSK
jgi:hypothetical protein